MSIIWVPVYYKLLVCYQGIAEFLDRCFAEEYELQNSKFRSRLQVLIVPYRKADTQNDLLYSRSSPVRRLSLIQIDYTKMFDVHDMLFILLHELGHRLGNRMRRERTILYTKAAISFVLSEIFNYYYEDVEELFLVPLKQAALQKAITLTEDEKADISRVEEQFIHITTESIAGLFVREYEEWAKEIASQCLADEIIVREYFFSWVETKLKEFLIDMADNFMRFDDPGFNRGLIALIRDAFYKTGREIADRVVERYSNDQALQKNIRTALLLQNRYDAILKSPDYIQNKCISIGKDIRHIIENGALRTISDIFKDVYSDIFSICILKQEKVNAKDYVGLISAFEGADMERVVCLERTILRFSTVLETFYPNVSYAEEVEKLGVRRSVAEWVSEGHSKHTRSAYYPYILKYGQLVRENSTVRIRELTSNNKETRNAFDQISYMFKGNSEQITNGIYYFWKYCIDPEQH